MFLCGKRGGRHCSGGAEERRRPRRVGKVGSLHGTLLYSYSIATASAAFSWNRPRSGACEGQKEGPASSSNQFSQPSDKEVRAN